MNRPSAPRVLLGAAGAAMIAYGGWQIMTHSSATKPDALGKWLLVALVLHDGVLAGLVVSAGWLIARFVPGRGRAYLAGALTSAALVSVIALPLMYRRGKSVRGSTLLTQDYPAHLGVLLAAIAAVATVAWAVRVWRDRRQGRSRANDRPSADQTSPTR